MNLLDLHCFFFFHLVRSRLAKYTAMTFHLQQAVDRFPCLQHSVY